MYEFILASLALVSGFALGFFVAVRWNKQKRSQTDVLFFPDDKKPCRSFYNRLTGNGNPDCFHRDCKFAHQRDGELTSFMEIVLTLNGARRSIDLCVFDFTQVDLKRLLISARNQGIVVRIITDAHPDRQQLSAQQAAQAEEGTMSPVSVASHKNKNKKNNNNNDNNNNNSNSNNSNNKPSIQEMVDQIPLLQKAGIPIKVNKAHGSKPGKMHNKFVLVDGEFLLMGSFNWTHSAIVKNDEAVIRTNEPRIVGQFAARFNKMWADFEERAKS